jgi:predicted nucleic acid-binding protein
MIIRDFHPDITEQIITNKKAAKTLRMNTGLMNVLLDANICLDILLKRNPGKAEKIIDLAESGILSLFVSTSIVHILAYWTTKNYGFEIARELLLHLLDNVEVLDLPHKETIHAIAMAKSDMEDSIQLKIALFHELDFIITNDVNFIKEASPIITILSLEAFLIKFT